MPDHAPVAGRGFYQLKPKRFIETPRPGVNKQPSEIIMLPIIIPAPDSINMRPKSRFVPGEQSRPIVNTRQSERQALVDRRRAECRRPRTYVRRWALDADSPTHRLHSTVSHGGQAMPNPARHESSSPDLPRRIPRPARSARGRRRPAQRPRPPARCRPRSSAWHVLRCAVRG
jgi:hypothetical protein